MSSTPHFQGQSTLSELFTVVYVLVDDYLKSSLLAGRFSLPVADSQKGSYAELMTIALVGELRSQDHLFPENESKLKRRDRPNLEH